MRIISQNRENDIPYEMMILSIDSTSNMSQPVEKPFLITARSSEYINSGSFWILGEFDTYGDALNEMQNIQEYYEKGMKIYRVG